MLGIVKSYKLKYVNMFVIEGFVCLLYCLNVRVRYFVYGMWWFSCKIGINLVWLLLKYWLNRI